MNRKVEFPGGVEDDLGFRSWVGVAGGLFLCVCVRIEGPGLWRWSSLMRISGLSALWLWVDLPRESIMGIW